MFCEKELNNFIRLFRNPLIQDYINATYVSICDIKNVDLNKIENRTNILNPMLNSKFSSYGIVGLPASGKTFLSNKIMEKKKLKRISTDNFVYEIKDYIIKNNFEEKSKYNLDSCKSNSDMFKKFEYHAVVTLLLSELSSEKVIDFGGSVFLQPHLCLLLPNVMKYDVINLKIEQESRVCNLLQDYIFFDNDGFRKTLNNELNKVINAENNIHVFNELKTRYMKLCKENDNFKIAKDRFNALKQNLKTQNEKNLFTKMFAISKKWDDDRLWRQRVYDGYIKSTNFEESLEKLNIK